MTVKRVVIITGGASGIGQQACLTFSQKGDRVIVADYDKANGEKTARQIRTEGGEAAFIQVNVAKQTEVEGLVDKTVDLYGRVDIMVNNAGIGGAGSVLEQPMERYYKVIDINQHGVAYGIIAAGRKMKDLGIKGVIINMTSVFGYLASPGTFAYHAAKGAVNMMTKSAALELAPYGIRVIALAPGVVDTPIIQFYKDQGLLTAMKEKVMGGEITSPSLIAKAMYLLSLEEANAVNGSVVMADQGFASFK